MAHQRGEPDADYEILVPVESIYEALDEIAEQIDRKRLDGPAAAALVRVVRARAEQKAVLTVAERILAKASAGED